MKIVRCENVNDVAKSVERELRLKVEKVGSRIFLPTGKTPLPLYALMGQDKNFWFKRFNAIQIDEFVQPERIFFHELLANVVGPLQLDCQTWDPEYNDDEIKSHVENVLGDPIDVAILGLGPNGHVGFHEPGAPRDFIGGRRTVSDQTRSRVRGATTCEVETFGVGAFMKAKEIFLIVTGKEKEKIFSEFQKSSADEKLPASLLKNHPNLTVFTELK